MTQESVERAMIRSHYPDKQKLWKTIIKRFTKEQYESTDSIECHYCINLCYLSYVKCTKCKGKTYCIAHEIQCGCDPSKIRIYERYSDKELNQFLIDAKKNIEFPKKSKFWLHVVLGFNFSFSSSEKYQKTEKEH